MLNKFHLQRHLEAAFDIRGASQMVESYFCENMLEANSCDKWQLGSSFVTFCQILSTVKFVKNIKFVKKCQICLSGKVTEEN